MKQEQEYSIEELEKIRIFHHFFQICKIPHPSYKEKELSDYIKNWGENLNLEVLQDAYYNVLIRKKGTPGKEKNPVVLLQAHMDMVSQKEVGVEHDFEKDPIIPVVEGDLISTGGKTTLGADNGIGVAYMMALLESEDIPHPPLEALFTTVEEADMSGAENVDGSWFKAKYMINLDYASDDSILCGSCGGNGVQIKLPLKYEKPPNNGSWYLIEITGLPGGHSGEDIHRGHGNAGIFMGRLLKRLKEKSKIHLGDIKAGNFRLAIPRDAKAKVWISKEKESEFLSEIKAFEEIGKKEYPKASETFKMISHKLEDQEEIIKEEFFTKIIQGIFLAPNGISEMNNEMPKVVESSDNLGEVFIKDRVLYFVFEVRAAYDSTRIFLNQKLEMLAELMGGEMRVFSQYPEWKFDPQSILMKKAQKSYEKQFGIVPEAVVFHAGVESASLIAKVPNLIAIGLGPNAWGFHSPYECVSIKSTKKVFSFIKTFLGELS